MERTFCFLFPFSLYFVFVYFILYYHVTHSRCYFNCLILTPPIKLCWISFTSLRIKVFFLCVNGITHSYLQIYAGFSVPIKNLEWHPPYGLFIILPSLCLWLGKMYDAWHGVRLFEKSRHKCNHLNYYQTQVDNLSNHCFSVTRTTICTSQPPGSLGSTFHIIS